MATPLKPCLDCGALSKLSRCPQHQKAREKRHNDARSFYHSSLWDRLQSNCLVRYEGVCAICGSDHRVAAHHLEPRPKDEPNPTDLDHIDNLIALCQKCHTDYEADLRAGRASALRVIVEAVKGV